jgi:hypothetical protein
MVAVQGFEPLQTDLRIIGGGLNPSVATGSYGQ